MTSEGERLVLDGADGTDVILLDDDGRRFRLEVDDELRDAVRRSGRPASGSSSPAAGEEAGMDTGPNTELRPRDIQARVRAGATAEEIAEVTGTTVEKVLVYARPVLAERAHMAQRAQRSSVRRPGGDGSSGHRTLGDAVAKRLRAIDEDPTTVEWDSRKREDGRWVLTASYATEERSGLARFTFDPPGNFVTVDDGDARWLLGDDPERVAEPASPDRSAPGPRLVAVGEDELPLGGDALRLVDEPAGETGPYSTYTVEADVPAAETGPTGSVAGSVAGSDTGSDTGDTTETAEQAAVPEGTDGDDDPDGPDDDPPSRRRARKRGGRASVPSWDEIMFGGRRE